MVVYFEFIIINNVAVMLLALTVLRCVEKYLWLCYGVNLA